MPIHDWASVNQGLFHWFHQRWIGVLSDWLNAGRLPQGLYSIGELYSDQYVLAVADGPRENGLRSVSSGVGFGIALAESPPQTRFHWEAETKSYLARKDYLAIRNVEGILVAVIEIVSPGNKSSKARFNKFVQKTIDFLEQGVHVLVIDLFPPTLRDPHGIHHAIWTDYDGEFEFKPEKSLTLASYMAPSEDTNPKAFVQPIDVHETLPTMPLFLWPERYINVDLEATYASTWALYPEPLKPKIP